MTERSDVVDRANSLMRRRRSFVASITDKPDTPGPAATADEDDDLPVLTDIVAGEASAPSSRADRYDEEALLSIIATDLVRTLERQLATELPTLIEAALLSAQQELQTGINSTLEMALKAFLARRHQLSLPLDDLQPDD